jgi:hypothetical protein
MPLTVRPTSGADPPAREIRALSLTVIKVRATRTVADTVPRSRWSSTAMPTLNLAVDTNDLDEN